MRVRYVGCMSRTVSLIRSAELADVAQYAYAATAPAEARLLYEELTAG